MAFLFQVPISRNLGLVSLLAGVDPYTLDTIRGTAYSGELTEPVGIIIDVTRSLGQDAGKLGTVQYSYGESGSHGVIERRCFMDKARPHVQVATTT